MIKKVLVICLTAYFPVTANAETYAKITKITPNYTYSKAYKKEKSCHTVDTPIYGKTLNRGTSGGDVFAGMLLGSLLGKGATGKDKGAAVGAVLGGIIAAEKNNTTTSIIGYEPIRNCEIIQIPETMKTIKNYKIDYEWGDVMGSSYTYNRYHVGQHIPISISIIAN